MDIAGEVHPSRLGVTAEFNCLTAGIVRPRVLTYEPLASVGRDTTVIEARRLRAKSARGIAA